MFGHDPLCARLISGRRSEHDAVVSHGSSRLVPRFARHSLFGMSLPLRTRFVPFFPPPGSPGRRTLFRAYRVRARAGVGAGAVRAPDCARARGKCRAHLSRAFRWGFFAPARGNRRSGPRIPLPPVPSYHNFSEVKLFSVNFLSYPNKAQLPLERNPFELNPNWNRTQDRHPGPRAGVQNRFRNLVKPRWTGPRISTPLRPG